MFTYVAGEAGRVTPHSALHSQMNNTQGLLLDARSIMKANIAFFHSNTWIVISIELYLC